MNNLLSHMMESSVYLVIFYGFFLIFLRRDTFFTRNRVYLLSSYICALALPVIDFSIPEYSYTLHIDKSFVSEMINSNIVSTGHHFGSHTWSYMNLVCFLYLFIAALLFLMLIIRLGRLVLLISSGSKIRRKDFILVISKNVTQPFSFLNFIFFSPRYHNREYRRAILIHEIGHIKYRHSLDILLAEVVKILMWFNPVVWIMQRSLAEVHEYQADAFILQQGFPRQTYQKILIHSSAESSNLLFVHAFNSSGLKRRILMMRKNKNRPLMYMKLAVLLPVIFLILCVHSASAKDNPFILPIETGMITSPFGMRMHPITKKIMHHNGIDIGSPKGTPVLATAGGIVIQTGEKKGPGKYILLQHENGWQSFYSQLETINVKSEETVRQGEQIGAVGSSGISTAPHLHFELHLNGEPVDPENHIDFSLLGQNK